MNKLEYLKNQYKHGRNLGNENAYKIYLHYRRYAGKIFLLTCLVCVLFGVWNYALLFFLVWHFHQIIVDNWYVITGAQKVDGNN